MENTESQLLMRRVLLHHFQKTREVNPLFSLRAFSQKLSVAPGTLSQILNGKRSVTKKFAQTVCDQLKLTPAERNKILKSFKSEPRRYQSEDRLLTLEEFGKIHQWVHFAILSLIKTDDFKADPQWIAERLGITNQAATEALQNLLDLKLLEFKDKNLVRTNKRIMTEDDRASLEIRKAHKESLDLAKEALDELPIHLRDFTTTTLPMDPDIMPIVKEKIRSFYDELESFILEQTGKSEVYRMSIELFPLTKVNKRVRS